MPLEDLKFGSKKNREPKKLTLDRPDGPKEIPDILFHYSGEKRVDIERAKEVLEKYLAKVPDAKWVDLKDHFDVLTREFSDKDIVALKKYFEELKKAQTLREKIVEKINPAFNRAALYMHEKLREDPNSSYGDIIISYFAEHLDEPFLGDVTDEVLKKLEDVFPKIQSKYQNSVE